MFAAIAPLLIFIAFILLLLVSLSAPIIKSIFLFRLAANVSSGLLNSNANGKVNFGVWGYCVSAIQVSVAGFDRSRGAQCSGTHLGYTIDETIASVLNADDIRNVLSRTTTAALVIHPIACGLTFLTFIISLFILRRGSNGTSRLPSLLTLGVGLTAALLTTVVFLIDVIFVAVVRHRVRDASDGNLTLTWGNAVWMTLGATVALWLAMVGACAGVCACGGRNRRKAETY
ncbi:actin cortical patch SUR7/pH-response regulator pali [Crucibulum laeve]|uniref:Actin cortical patch SUR7/pH-response regulator pali n=1 Tax=Crucibulum laeve TaxID=68775 RepID=A0A5C3MB86_9AGAR|nr:actin cortical patch SUR7/pH-response regulator pali [Crucibulum laeve]